MSNDKLTEALREYIEGLKDVGGKGSLSDIAMALEFIIQQAHAAEAAQPLPQMTDAEHAEILAKYGAAQDAKDAARYRWLRAQHDSSIPSWHVRTITDSIPVDLDAEIDEAMAKEFP